MCALSSALSCTFHFVCVFSHLLNAVFIIPYGVLIVICCGSVIGCLHFAVSVHIWCMISSYNGMICFCMRSLVVFQLILLLSWTLQCVSLSAWLSFAALAPVPALACLSFLAVLALLLPPPLAFPACPVPLLSFRLLGTFGVCLSRIDYAHSQGSARRRAGSGAVFGMHGFVLYCIMFSFLIAWIHLDLFCWPFCSAPISSSALGWLLQLGTSRWLVCLQGSLSPC